MEEEIMTFAITKRLAAASGLAVVLTFPVIAEAQETPKPGGTLTYMTERSRDQPPGWDVEEAASATAMLYVNPYEEYLMIADVLKFGPRGTNEFPFSMMEEEVPERYLTGSLAESWEITKDPVGVKFHIRKGVMWTGNKNIGMAPREFTAEDAAFALNRYRDGKQAGKIKHFIDSGAFKAVDKYTLQATFKTFNAAWAWIIGYALYSPMYPPEVVKAGPMDWRNAVGTGPFILSDYADGSYVTYQKNPNWWNKEQTINGKKYATPFIDELSFPIITSPAAQLAAIRTGQVDLATMVPVTNEQTLRSTSPDLNIKKMPSGRAMDLVFNSTKGPSQDLAFRRAIMVGLDEQAIVNAVLPGGTIGGQPYSRYLGNNIFTPIEEMPKEIAELYGYDPQRAKEMITQAGKAGAKLPIYYSNSDNRSAQATALIADQLSKIGIVPVLTPVEAAVLSKYQTGDTSWEGVLLWFGGNSKTARGADGFRAFPYSSLNKDAGHNERMDRIMAITDGDERDRELKKEGVYMIGQVGEIAIGEAPVLTVWWPWVKNYYGEVEAGFNNSNPMFSTLWIDQDLKKKMGF
jgi:peptide/nickel transport system substrate-binding protein